MAFDTMHESPRIAVVRRLLDLVDLAASADDGRPYLAQIYNEILAEGFVYQNRPQKATRGRREFGSWMREFADVTAMSCEILRVAEVGNWVLTERVDGWTIGGVQVTVPLMGSFEVDDAMRVASWTDYVPYSAEWQSSGQMRPGFFDDWTDTDLDIIT
jgi:limonene-1,2-epoxide hydrolase